MTSKQFSATRLSLTCGLVLAAASLAIAADDKKEERKAIPITDVKHDGPVDFEKEVLPVLIKKCQACHNATDAESDLVLETPQSILKGGFEGPAVVPGKSAESLLLKLAAHQQGPVMPPADNNRGAKNLTSEELGLIKLWIDEGAKGEVTGLAGAPKWQPLPQGVNPVYAVAISPDGQFVAAGRANQIFLYHAASKRELGRLTDPELLKSGAYDKPGVAHLDLVQALAFSPDNQWLASGGYRTVKLWRREPNAKVADLPALAEAPLCLDVSSDGKLAAFGQASGKIQLYDLAAKKAVRTLEGHTGAVHGVAFTADGSKLVSGSQDKTFRVWNTADGKPIDDAVETPSAIGAVTLVAEDQQVATGGEDKTIRLWNLPGSEAAEAAKKEALEAAKKAAEGKEGEEAKVAPQPPQPVAELAGHSAPVTSLAAMAPSGAQLVSGSQDATVRVWDVPGKKAIRSMSHGGPVVSVAVRSDGKRIASASSNNTAKLWDAANGQQVAELRGDLRTKLNVEDVTRAVALAKTKIDDTKKDLEEAEKRKTAEEENLKKTEETLKTAAEEFKKKEEAAKKPVADKEAADKKLAEAMAALPKAEEAKKKSDELATKADTDAKAAAEAAAKAAADAKTAADAATKAAADATAAAKVLTDAQTALTAATKAVTDADAAAKAAADKLTAAQEAAKKEPENKALADAAKAAEEAAKKADEAAKAAATAKTAAEKAVADAEAKKKTADAAKVAADKTKADADAAKLAADKKKTDADAAKVAADEAKKKTDAEFTNATNAVKTAEAEVKKTEPIATKAVDEKNAAERAHKAAERSVARSKDSVQKATETIPVIQDLVKKAEEAHKQTEAQLEEAKKAVTESEKPLHAVAFSIDGSTLASVGDDQLVHTWDSETGAAIDTFSGQGAPISVVGFTATGDVLAAAQNKTAIVWDADAEWKLARTIGSADSSDMLVDRVTALNFSPDSKLLATGGGEPSRSGELKIFNVADGALVKEIPEAHSDTIFSLEFSPSGEYLASSGADRFVKTFEVASGKFVKSFEGHTHHVLGVSWSADGKMLASSGADNVIKTWNFKTGDQIRTITGFNKEVTAVRFVSISPNVVASCGDKNVYMKRADNGGNVRSFSGGGDFMYSVGVSADGKTIVSGGQDSVVRIWQDSGTVLAAFAPPVIEQTASTDSGE
ncbi:MAG: c-type cytochrome domain-containing protein [Pirellulaceae bacterium]